MIPLLLCPCVAVNMPTDYIEICLRSYADQKDIQYFSKYITLLFHEKLLNGF